MNTTTIRKALYVAVLLSVALSIIFAPVTYMVHLQPAVRERLPVPSSEPIESVVKTITDADLVEELPSQPRRLLIVGDSEACTVAPFVNLVKFPTDTVDVDCKGGTVVEYWANGAFQMALDRHPKPDVVIIFLGTNNYWNVKKFPDAGPILHLMNEQGISCVWVGNTAVYGKKWPVNQHLKSQVEPMCQYFDTEESGLSLWDGVHTDRENSIQWLHLIWQIL